MEGVEVFGSLRGSFVHSEQVEIPFIQLIIQNSANIHKLLIARVILKLNKTSSKMTVSNQPSLPSTWKDQIQNNPDQESLTTNAADILANITPTKAPNDLKSLISQEEELFILVKSNTHNTRPLLLHHAKIAKGSTQNGGLGSETLILHQGLEAHAIPFVVDPVQLFTILQDIPKPSYDPFFTANSQADLDALNPIDVDAVINNCR